MLGMTPDLVQSQVDILALFSVFVVWRPSGVLILCQAGLPFLVLGHRASRDCCVLIYPRSLGRISFSHILLRRLR